MLNFYFVKVKSYIEEKRRQVNAFNKFYEGTSQMVGSNVAEFSAADIPRTMLKKKYVFVCDLSILPTDEDKFNSYSFDNIYDKVTQEKKWYNNDTTVAKIR